MDNSTEAALIDWFQVFGQQEVTSYEHMLDGAAIALAMRQMCSYQIEQSTPEIAWKGILGVLERHFEVPISHVHTNEIISALSSGFLSDSARSELTRALELVLCCAVESDKKETFIQNILSMESTTQVVLMSSIQNTMALLASFGGSDGDDDGNDLLCPEIPRQYPPSPRPTFVSENEGTPARSLPLSSQKAREASGRRRSFSPDKRLSLDVRSMAFSPSSPCLPLSQLSPATRKRSPLFPTTSVRSKTQQLSSHPTNEKENTPTWRQSSHNSTPTFEKLGTGDVLEAERRLRELNARIHHLAAENDELRKSLAESLAVTTVTPLVSSPSLGSDLRDASEETNNAQLREAALMWERAAAERESELKANHDAREQENERAIQKLKKELRTQTDRCLALVRAADEADCLREAAERGARAEENVARLKARLASLVDVQEQMKNIEAENGRLIERVLSLESAEERLDAALRRSAEAKQRADSAELALSEVRAELLETASERSILLQRLALSAEEGAALYSETRLRSERLRHLEDQLTVGRIEAGLEDGGGLGEGLSELNPAVRSRLARLEAANAALRERVSAEAAENVSTLSERLSDIIRQKGMFEEKYTSTRSALRASEGRCAELESALAGSRAQVDILSGRCDALESELAEERARRHKAEERIIQLTDRERDLERLLQVSTRETANKEEEMRIARESAIAAAEAVSRQHANAMTEAAGVLEQVKKDAVVQMHHWAERLATAEASAEERAAQMRAEFDMRLNETYSAASATAEQVRHDWLARLAALEARAATDLAAADGERQRLAAEWAVEKAGLEDRHRSVQQCWATERENIALSRAADAALWDDERQSMLERALAREAALREERTAAEAKLLATAAEATAAAASLAADELSAEKKVRAELKFKLDAMADEMRTFQLEHSVSTAEHDREVGLMKAAAEQAATAAELRHCALSATLTAAQEDLVSTRRLLAEIKAAQSKTERENSALRENVSRLTGSKEKLERERQHLLAKEAALRESDGRSLGAGDISASAATLKMVTEELKEIGGKLEVAQQRLDRCRCNAGLGGSSGATISVSTAAVLLGGMGGEISSFDSSASATDVPLENARAARAREEKLRREKQQLLLFQASASAEIEALTGQLREARAEVRRGDEERTKLALRLERTDRTLRKEREERSGGGEMAGASTAVAAAVGGAQAPSDSFPMVSSPAGHMTAVAMRSLADAEAFVVANAATATAAAAAAAVAASTLSNSHAMTGAALSNNHSGALVTSSGSVTGSSGASVRELLERERQERQLRATAAITLNVPNVASATSSKAMLVAALRSPMDKLHPASLSQPDGLAKMMLRSRGERLSSATMVVPTNPNSARSPPAPVPCHVALSSPAAVSLDPINRKRAIDVDRQLVFSATGAAVASPQLKSSQPSVALKHSVLAGDDETGDCKQQ